MARTAPSFWYEADGRHAAPLLRALLTPLGWIYAASVRRRLRTTLPFDCGVPVICVGNLTAGGTGKTPVVRDLCQRLQAQGHTPAVLSRGYGGQLSGPVWVTPDHTAQDVGDEPLMLSKTAPVMVARDRVAGAKAIVETGHDVVVMDDGHQNPSLKKTLSLVVVDATRGLGNGRVIPAGPLREPATAGLARADAVVLMGTGTPDLPAHPHPTMRATVSANDQAPSGPLVAFAGIGQPEKFFTTLPDLGAEVHETIPFPDHHPYTPADLQRLQDLAQHHQARLITTEKDAMRLPPAFQTQVLTLPITLVWEAPETIDNFLQDLFA